MGAVFYIVMAFVGYLVTIGFIVLLIWVLRSLGVDEKTTMSDKEDISLPHARIHWRLYLIVGPFMSLFIFIAGSLEARSPIHGYPVIQIILGQMLGALIFMPLGEFILRKAKLAGLWQILFPIIFSMQFYGPMLAVGIMKALGLPVTHIFPLAIP